MSGLISTALFFWLIDFGSAVFEQGEQGLIRGGIQRDSAGGKLQRKSAGVKPKPMARPQPEAAVGVRVGWQAAIAGTVEGLGYELVDTERAQRGLLRITIDRVPGRAYSAQGGTMAAGSAGDGSELVTVEDCEKVTRQLQYALEVEGLDYARLEVSSPGLDRPLKRAEDYERFAGLAVQITLKTPFKGRKNWQGVLTAAGVELDGPSTAAQADGQATATATATPPAAWALVIKDGKTEQVLRFNLTEVREARLVPVVDFKGRKVKDGSGAQAPVAAKQQDGG